MLTLSLYIHVYGLTLQLWRYSFGKPLSPSPTMTCTVCPGSRLGVSVTGDWVSGHISLSPHLPAPTTEAHAHPLGRKLELPLGGLQDHVRSCMFSQRSHG